MFLSRITTKPVATGVILFSFALATIAWTPSSPGTVKNVLHVTDTVPGKNKKLNYDQAPGDLDQQIEQLEHGLQKLDKELQGTKFDKLDQQLAASLGKIDVAAIQRNVEEAMKNIDFNKLRLETSEALKKIDMEKIQQQIRDAIDEIKDKTESKKLQQELKESLKEVQKSIAEASKITHKELDKELENARAQWQKEKVNIDKELQKAKEELKNNKGVIKESMTAARAEIERVKEELQSYKKMITSMDKEGLLKADEDYTIDFRDDSLIINGKKQSQQTFDAYKSYFTRDNVHIKNAKGNFKVNTDK